MSSSAEVHINGNGNSQHDRILRPRAVKTSNPVVLRALSEEGYLSVNGGIELTENGSSTTRQVSAFLP